MAETAKKTVDKPLKPTRVVTRRRTTPTGARANHKAAPQKLKLLITVVNRNKTEYFMDLIQSFDVNMQFCTAAKGTASTDILSLMGLEESTKNVIFSIIREDRAAAALAALENKFATIKNGKGIAMTAPLTGVIGVSIYQFLCDNRKAVREEK